MRNIHNIDRIFTFWTGDSPMNQGRIKALATTSKTGMNHVHIERDKINDWELKGNPFHPAYSLLSEVHKADYLRCYFMNFYGGGYTDIKYHSMSWLPSLERIERSRLLVGGGYREVRGGTPYLEKHRIHERPYVLGRAVAPWQARTVTNMMRGGRYFMIGNCAFLFKPGTWFTRYWYSELCRRLDALAPDLLKYPPSHARDRLGGLEGFPYSGYPVPWSFLLGDILGPLSLLAAPLLSRDLPVVSVNGYLD